MPDGAVLITGASSGIGRATALRLARRGYRVFAGVRDPADGEQLVADAAGDLTPLRIDVTDEAEIRLAAAEIEDVPLAGLVNNAGIAIGGPLELLPLDEFRRQIEVNLTGQLAVIQAFMPQLRAGRGRIINITSIGGKVAQPFMGPYHAAKFGFEALSDSLRMELLPFGVDVIVVEPGSIKTEIWDKGEDYLETMRAALGPRGLELYGEQVESMRGVIEAVGRRALKPERVARVIEKALSARRPRARYIVGPDARLLWLMRKALPARLADRLNTRGIGLPSG